MLVSQNIANLLGGVSQQPPYRREFNQLDELINGYPLYQKPLMRRPPLQHIARLTSTVTGIRDAFVHTISRDLGERYHVIIINGDLFVYDANTGAAKTVTFPDGKAYLSGTAFRAFTVGDFTFIANRATTVAKKSTTTPAKVYEALIFARKADYKTTYSVTLNGITKSYTTPSGASPNDRVFITTDNIASQLQIALSADGTLGPAFQFTGLGSAIHLKRNDGADFTLTCHDGMAENGLLAIKGNVQRFEDLPLRAKSGMIVEVSGDPGSERDNYYVVYDDSATAGNAGVWRETLKWGENFELDEATMPHILVRNGDGTFTFKRAAWRDREVGSLLTNPFPSFLGRKINEVFFTQGRLGFTAGESVILSGAADLFNFFRKSAKALYDNDLIDVSASFARVNKWHSASEWNERPLLWSDQGQAILDSGNQPLSPKTVNLRALTNYDNQANCRPLTLGKHVWFAQVISGKTRVSEYFVPPYKDLPEAFDTTTEIPTYISGSPRMIVGTEQPGIVAVLTDTDRGSLYIHNFQYNGEEKVQAAWHKWTFPGAYIVGIDYIGGKLSLLTLRADGFYLESMDLGKIPQPAKTTSVTTGTIGSTPTGRVGDVGFTITPWASALGNAPSVGGTFESTISGHGSTSKDINIYFDKAVASATVTIHDLTWLGNLAKFYDETGTLLGTLTYGASNTPGDGYTEARTFTAPGIRRIELIVATSQPEYVTYDISITAGSSDPVYLDRGFASTLAGVSSSFDGLETRWMLPFPLLEGAQIVKLVNGQLVSIPFQSIDSGNSILETTGGQGDLTGLTVYFGTPYEFYARLSDLFLREDKRGIVGTVAQSAGRTTVRYLTLLLQDTNYLTVKVTPDGRSAYTYTYDKATAQPSDQFKVPVGATNDQVMIEVTSSQQRGLGLAGLDAEFNYHIRSQRR